MNDGPPPPSRAMITLDIGDARFSFRTVGVAIHDDRVLLHRAEWDDFWALPGGRVELGEPASESLRREMREELGVEVRVERLLWVVENFFGDQGREQHRLAFYFLMTFPPDHHYYRATAPFAGHEEGIPLTFRWFPFADLDTTVHYPPFLRTALRDLPLTPTHIVYTDPQEADPADAHGA